VQLIYAKRENRIGYREHRLLPYLQEVINLRNNWVCAGCVDDRIRDINDHIVSFVAPLRIDCVSCG
jgi:hypothetical protein